MSNSVAAFELNSNFGMSSDDGGISSKDDSVFLQNMIGDFFKRYGTICSKDYTKAIYYDYEVFLWRGV